MTLDLTLFDSNPNTTADSNLSAEMRTYYSDYLIDNAKPNLVHDQFGQKHPIPKNGGKTIQFRKFVPFSKATAPLSEGITPDGGALSVTNVTASVEQYGYYVTISDMLMLTAVDNTLVETTKLLGAQAGSTLDTITREVLNGGTSVMYAGGKEAREALDETCKLKVDDVYKAARFLKTQNAPKIDGSYVAIIHPDVAYDLMRDEEWIDVHKYNSTTEIFEGEIGKLAGVRFVESTEAKIFSGEGANARDIYSTLVLG
ncbi:MAG: N4-gp56 family major capsid protein, partial [Clostridia bacterium]|nr:N4-gp56 family major capsid protein [Clostridia bacterium]